MLSPRDFTEGPVEVPPPDRSPQLTAFEAVREDVAPVVLQAELRDTYGLDVETSADIAAQAALDQADLDSLTYAQNE